MLTFTKIKEHILDNYDIEDVMNALYLDLEKILDKFEEEIYDNLENFGLDEVTVSDENDWGDY